MEDVADLEAPFHMQGDAGEEVAKGVLESETEDRGDDRAGGERAVDREAEPLVRGQGQEEDVDDDGEDLPQQLRRENVAPPRHGQVEDERIEDAHDEDQQRRERRELHVIRIGFIEVPALPMLLAVQIGVEGEKSRAADQREEVTGFADSPDGVTPPPGAGPD